MPVLSPCNRIVQAKRLIVQAKEEEVAGKLETALNKYQEGSVKRKLIVDSTRIPSREYQIEG